MARPKGIRKSERVSVSLDAEAHQALKDYAAQDDVSIAWLIRRAVNDMLGHRESSRPGNRKTASKSGARGN